MDAPLVIGDQAAEPHADRDAVGGLALHGGRPATGEPLAAVPLPGILAQIERGRFVGRAAPLRRMRKRWSDAAETAGLVVLEGEPGIGKTRLVARLAAQVHAQGDVVLYGRADEESVSPYQPFVEALRHYAAHRPRVAEETRLAAAAARELARLVPELGWSAAAVIDREPRRSERSRPELLDAFARLLLHPARTQRLLLVLEDLHSADAPTLLLLRELVRRSAGLPVLIVATYRDLEADASGLLARVLVDLRRETRVDTIRLAGFGLSETAGLIAAHRGRGSDHAALAQRLHEETGGNPFFIEELLHTPLPPFGGVPQGVKDVLGRRLDSLPAATVEALTLAAVLGSNFRLSALQTVVSEQSQDELIASLEAAVAARLIHEDPEEVDRFSFAHALVRETLYERPIASRRVRLHRNVAMALEAAPLPVPPAELAHHYFQAREVGCAAKAIVYSLRAGQALQEAHCYEDAAKHYERALGLLEMVRRDDDAARCDVLLALGDARWQASQPDPRSTFLEAVELARRLPSSERLALAVLGAGGRFYAPGATDHGYIELLEEALAALGPGDSVLRVRVLARLAEKLVFAEPPERAVELADEAVATAGRLGEPGARLAALMGCHAARLYAGHAPERYRIGEQALALAEELEQREQAALARHWRVYDLAELGELAEARRRLAALERVAEELQQPLYRHSSLAWRGVWAALDGRLGEAERIAEETVRLAEHAGAPDARATFTAQLVAVRREQGRLHDLLPAIERLAGDEPAAAAWRCLAPLAHLDAGDRARAWAAYETALGSVPRTMLWLPATASLAEAAALLGDAEGAARLYAELEPHADRFVQWGFTGNAGSVQRLLGRTAATAGRRHEADAHFAEALARHSAVGAAPLAARTRCDHGELLMRGTSAGCREGRRLLRQARAAARAFGMTGIEARADRALAEENLRCSS